VLNFKSIKKAVQSTLGLLPDLSTWRPRAVFALADVPMAAKSALLERLPYLRRVGDWQDMRCSLFDVLSRCHGEAIARTRMVSIDGSLG